MRWLKIMSSEALRTDYKIISEWIEPGTFVLDLGCGTGELLYYLIKNKSVRGQGIEIDEQAIYQCVAKGLNVLHGDIDSGLSEFNDKTFDYVIMNQSLQQIQHVDSVLKDALRVGKRVIAGFPNFAHLRARVQILFSGRTPVVGALPYQWFETPNLHFLSIKDFTDYCSLRKLVIENRAFLRDSKRIHLFPNLFAETGIFKISFKEGVSNYG